MRKRPDSPMWQYLESVGVLEKGTDEQIKAAKKAYWKKYFLRYKQKQRGTKPEFTVNFSKENGEYERVTLAAKRHNVTVTSFIHSAVIAYIEQRYVVPDRLQIAKLEQLLSDCLNEIKAIIKPKERFFWEREQKLNAIEKRIEKLEAQVNEVFRNPPLLSSHDHKNKVA